MQELREGLKVDKDNLDQALLEQVDYFHKVAEARAYAVSRKDEAAESIKRTEADLYLTIRQQAEEDGHKVTEKYLEAQVNSDGDRAKAVDEYLEAKKEADELTALMEAYSQRSYMLRELVQLYLAGYSVSNIADGAKYDVEDAQHKKRRRKIAESRASA